MSQIADKDIPVDEKLLAESICDSSSHIQEGIRKLEDLLLRSKSSDLQLEIEPHVHQIAVATASITRHAKQWANTQNSSTFIDLIYALSKKTRKYSLEYIRATKASCSNTMDFMTSEDQKSARKHLQQTTACIVIIAVTLIHQKFQYLFADEESAEPNETVLSIVSIAHELAVQTRKIVRVAAKGDPLTMLQEADDFFAVLNEFILFIKERSSSSELFDMTESLRRYKVELIHLSQDASPKISLAASERSKEKLIQQRTQSTLAAILEQEMEILVIFIVTQNESSRVASPDFKREKKEIKVSVGPKRPQKPRNRGGVRIPDDDDMRRFNKRSATSIALPTEKIKSRNISESPIGLRSVKVESPRDRTQSVFDESPRRGVLDEKQRVSLEATMATSVPVVISLFSSKFHWFQKEWERENSETKQQFMTEMRNALTKLNTDELSSQARMGIKQITTLPQAAPVTSTRSMGSIRTRNRNFSRTSSRFKKMDEKEENELQQILVPLSTPVRWYHRSVSLSNILNQDTVRMLKKYEITIEERIKQICSLVASEIQDANEQDEFSKSLSTLAAGIYQSYSKVISLSSPGSSNQIVHQMALPVNELIMSSTTTGNEDAALIGVLRDANSHSLTQMIVHHLMFHIREKLLSLQALGFQTVYIIHSIDQESQQKISHASTLQLLAITRRVVNIVESLLDQVATLLHIRQHFTADTITTRPLRQTISDSEDIPYWSYKPKDDESPELASLNYLIFILTSPLQDIPDGFEAAFLNMYETFCSAYKFFAKLVERYLIPDSAEYSDGAVRQLRFRICDILKTWMERRFFELDRFTKEKMTVFITKHLVADGFEDNAKELLGIMQRKAQEEDAMSKELFQEIPPFPRKAEDPSESLYQAFLTTDEKTIAEQLTLHDWNIFCRIRASELMGQKWNKSKHCASNVLDHIQRLNHVSYWVPSLILWSEKLKERGTVLWKFVRIGQELLKLKNYNTLMGIVAGLNMSSVLRLKFTMTVLSDMQVKEMEQLLELMGPFKRYKKYKDHIAAASLPAIPYLGAYLGDLTFIEDGNPDISAGMIYFGKRLKVSTILEEIRQFQQTPYEIETEEPLASYLKELPGLDDDALFQLSLIREPRDAEITDIL